MSNPPTDGSQLDLGAIADTLEAYLDVSRDRRESLKAALVTSFAAPGEKDKEASKADAKSKQAASKTRAIEARMTRLAMVR